MAGTSGIDTLAGAAGDDSLVGSDHDDVLGGDTLANHIDGGAGDDSLTGLGGRDTLIGEDGDDILSGGAAVDVLQGGLGADSPTGGAGVDTFVLTSADETGLGTQRDRITDFVTGADVVDLSALDLTFVASGGFSGGSAQVVFVQSGGNVLIQFDIDGDTVADGVIVLAGATISQTDLIL